MIGFVVQTTILFAILYYFPLFGPLADEAGVVGATVLAILASAIVSFVGDLIRAPVRIDAQQRVDLGRAYRVLEELDTEEASVKSLCDLYARGCSEYAKMETKEALQQSYDAWNGDCEALISERFSSASMHEFRSTPPRSANRLYVNSPISDHSDLATGRLMQIYEGKLLAIDDMIRSHGVNFIGHKNVMKSALEARKWEHYDLLLPPETGNK